MTTYMNQIVQATRSMNAIEAAGYSVDTSAAYQELMSKRGMLILKAIEVGLDAGMISRVIGMTSDAMTAQLQLALAHLVSAEVAS